jgi:hypothetical protein
VLVVLLTPPAVAAFGASSSAPTMGLLNELKKKLREKMKKKAKLE